MKNLISLLFIILFALLLAFNFTIEDKVFTNYVAIIFSILIIFIEGGRLIKGDDQ